MLYSLQDALTILQRAFPDCECIVADGSQAHESGIVTNRAGTTVASFRMVYPELSHGNQIPEIAEIRFGQPGQFCGTMDEIAEFERRFPSLSAAD